MDFVGWEPGFLGLPWEVTNQQGETSTLIHAAGTVSHALFLTILKMLSPSQVFVGCPSFGICLMCTCVYAQVINT